MQYKRLQRIFSCSTVMWIYFSPFFFLPQHSGTVSLKHNQLSFYHLTGDDKEHGKWMTNIEKTRGLRWMGKKYRVLTILGFSGTSWCRIRLVRRVSQLNIICFVHYLSMVTISGEGKQSIKHEVKWSTAVNTPGAMTVLLKLGSTMSKPPFF